MTYKNMTKLATDRPGSLIKEAAGRMAITAEEVANNLKRGGVTHAAAGAVNAAGSAAPGATFAQHAKNFYNNKILPNKKPLMIAGGVAAAGGLAMHMMGNNQQQSQY